MRRELSWLKGRTVRTVRHDEDSEMWVFDFGQGHLLQVTAPWRIADSNGVVLGHVDHRQHFGWAEPLDGQTVALELLKDRPVVLAVVVDAPGNLQLDFEPNVRLEVFNESSGYEAWTLSSPDGRMLVGLGGGEVDEWD